MRFLKRLAVGLVLLLAAFAVVVWLQPDDYRLTRSTVIWAPAAKIFPHVNHLDANQKVVAALRVASRNTRLNIELCCRRL